MNCDSCDEPKNSFSAATTGRMLMIVCGVIVSTSSVVMRSRTTRPIRQRPTRNAPRLRAHPGERHAERLGSELARRAESAVAEVLVLVELPANRIPREERRLGGIVLRVLGHAQLVRQLDELADDRDDVLGREDADVLRHLDAKTLVELVATDLRQVVPLGIEEEGTEEIPC